MVLLEVIALKDSFSDYVKIGIGTSGIGKMIVAVVAMLVFFAWVTATPGWHIIDTYCAVGAAVVLGYFLFDSLVTFRVNRQGIMKLRFGIPCRFVAWDEIIQIGCAKLYRGSCIVVTTRGCERFEYEVNNLDSYLADSYLWRNRHQTISIENEAVARPIIEKYYGRFDYDCTRVYRR